MIDHDLLSYKTCH